MKVITAARSFRTPGSLQAGPPLSLKDITPLSALNTGTQSQDVAVISSGSALLRILPLRKVVSRVHEVGFELFTESG